MQDGVKRVFERVILQTVIHVELTQLSITSLLLAS